MSNITDGKSRFYEKRALNANLHLKLFDTLNEYFYLCRILSANCEINAISLSSKPLTSMVR